MNGPDQGAPNQDPAAPILAGDPALSDEHRADLWDAFHSSKSPDELTQRLQDMATHPTSPLVVPDDTKKRLLAAKQSGMPAPGPMDKVSEAMNRIKQLDPATLELAESHPNVLKAMTAAATAPEKGAGEAAGSGKGAGKGTTASGDQKPAPLSLPPRMDGLQHMPPIPDGHKRLLASDGGVHDVPEENVAKAFQIDPRLHVLNP